MNATTLSESYAYCHHVMRTAARNFYFGMRLLPEPKRQGMHALYTFMRAIDDLADDGQVGNDPRRANLERFRDAAHRAIAGETSGHALWPAFADTVNRFHIPTRLFDDAIDGQLQDLVQNTYANFDELYQYCYRVASTVGIAAIYIWGFSDPRAPQLAEQRGIAMQLTNILRDLREDAARGRCYLPADDCRLFDCNDWTPAIAPPPSRFEDLVYFQANRAAEYYDLSSPLESMIDPDARPTLGIMTDIYHGILNRIIDSPHAVLRQRVSLSTLTKLKLVARHAWRGRKARLNGTL